MCAVMDAPLRSLHESKTFTTEDTEHLVSSAFSVSSVVKVFLQKPRKSPAPRALLVFRDALEQVQPAKIRPQSWGHVDFCVSELPQQEVAQPHLTGRAD